MGEDSVTTTHLFVELLVIGIGALAWLVLLGAALFGYDPVDFSGRLLSLGALFPTLAVAYLFGILVDRVADWSLDFWDRKHREACFGADRDAYFEARRTLLMKAPALWGHLEYGRSRLRICRGWALNCLLLLVSFNAAVAAGSLFPPITVPQAMAGSIFLVALGALCLASWRALNRKEYQKIQRQGEWIRQNLE